MRLLWWKAENIQKSELCIYTCIRTMESNGNRVVHHARNLRQYKAANSSRTRSLPLDILFRKQLYTGIYTNFKNRIHENASFYTTLIIKFQHSLFLNQNLVYKGIIFLVLTYKFKQFLFKSIQHNTARIF